MAMKPGMRMMLIDKMRPESYRSEYGNDPRRRMIGYDRDEPNMGGYGETEARRRRDSRGRYMEGDGWENNRYNPNMGGYPEARRRRDSRGRYAVRDPRMGDDEYDDEDDMHGQKWYPPNMNAGSRYGFGDVYADVYAPNAMNRPMHGGSEEDMMRPVDEHTARKWVKKMDGGEHFKAEQIEPFRASICPECGKWDFFVAVNAMYSDYCETAKKIGKDTPEFYAHLARDFLMDTDAKPGKLRRYMTHIAE